MNDRVRIGSAHNLPALVAVARPIFCRSRQFLLQKATSVSPVSSPIVSVTEVRASAGPASAMVMMKPTAERAGISEIAEDLEHATNERADGLSILISPY
jgi:hypothetical protein